MTKVKIIKNKMNKIKIIRNKIMNVLGELMNQNIFKQK